MESVIMLNVAVAILDNFENIPLFKLSAILSNKI